MNDRKRKRYRLARNPDYQMLHYIRLPTDTSTVPIQMGLIKVKPRMPASLPQHPTQNVVRPQGMPMQNNQRLLGVS